MAQKTCTISDCDRQQYAKDWCRPHYLRYQRYGDPEYGLPRYEECTVDGCASKPYARGWCNRHYLRWRIHGNPLGGRPARPDACHVDTCSGPVAVRGLCSRHYQRFRKHGDPLGGDPDRDRTGNGKPKGQCTVNGCEDPVKARGWCSAHYHRWQRHGNPLGGGSERTPVPRSGECSIEGCNHAVQARGWCALHYQRWFSHGDPMVVKTRRKDEPSRRINNQGYIELRWGKDGATISVLEHRLVMEQVIGRELYPFENVHHKNGIKTDNDPGNLEIWVRSQPAGQRLEDQITFYATYYLAEIQAMALNVRI